MSPEVAGGLDTREAVSVLVVDDNADHRILIEHWLGPQGHRVLHAGTAEEAMALLGQVQVVLLDYRLPGMTGLEFLRAVRDQPSCPAVVMITGMGSETVAVEALRAGAVDYLVKDRDYLEKLPSVVERAWRHHDLARRADQLQSLALNVTAAHHDEVFDDIVRGARTLLRADGTVLYAYTGEVLERLATVGLEAPDETAVAAEVMRQLAAPVIRLEADEPARIFVVPLDGGDADGAPSGALALLNQVERDYLPEEAKLAETFGAFAGIALASHARLAMQSKLVAHLEQAADARRQLLAAVSHELKTPLTCIAGFTETLIEHGQMFGDEERRDLLVRVRAHASELGQLLEQLLDVSASEWAPLEANVGSVDVNEQVRTVVEALAPVIRGRPVSVDVPDVQARADARLLRRALMNLISNAVKYSPAGSGIWIRGAVTDGAVTIDVVDRGPGLTEEEMARVFEPFWRAPRAIASATRGTGVGLALVREYARAMGGVVDVQSVHGEGATFSLRLPLHRPTPTSAG